MKTQGGGSRSSLIINSNHKPPQFLQFQSEEKGQMNFHFYTYLTLFLLVKLVLDTHQISKTTL